MAAKRLRDGSDQDSDKPEKSEQKKLRPLPSFSTVIREAVMVNSMQKLFGALEPLFRRVVQEEVERVLHSKPLFQRSPQLQIEEVESTKLRLEFSRPLSLPIFTGSKIEDLDNNPLQILLIDTRDGENSLAILPMPLKLQVVVLDGDFASEGNNWSSAAFDKHIIKERTGKRPLLTGEFPVILRDGVAAIGELTFTDNSSWIRSQHFRIGVKVVQESYKGPRIKEAITESFRVKDHRGELYKKHYPPALTDEVWRLERIGKDGAFHTRLSAKGIITVHDFLKLWAVDQMELRMILGVGMSDRMWEGTIGHARTCPIGERLYVHRKQQCAVFLNNICEVIAVSINGVTLSLQELNRSQKAHVQEIVREAYKNWDRLEESDGMLYNTFVLQNQPMPQPAIGASPWFLGSDIEIEDFAAVETPTMVLWGSSSITTTSNLNIQKNFG